MPISRPERPPSSQPASPRRADSRYLGFTLASGISLGVVALVLAGIMAGKWTFAEISRDPSAQFGFPIYGGFLSTFGFIGWIVTTAVTGLVAAVRPGLRGLMLPACLLSAVLAIDDQFMLHDVVLPRFGIPEKLVLISEAALCLRAVWPFLPALFRLQMPLLAVALAGFALSLLIDIMVHFGTGTALMVEDLAKFTGIVFWTMHWFCFAAGALRGQHLPR